MVKNITLILSFLLILLLTLAEGYSSVSRNDSSICSLGHKPGSKYFPSHFKFGVSTSAYQIEGAWNEDGRGPSMWDTFTHQHPELIDDQSNADVTADSYHKFDKDLEALKELKVNFYRFSMSWPRILPTGDITSKNQKGIDYYNMMIDKLLENGIEPVVTIFHYDLPEPLNLYGGFTNLLIVKYYANYAKLLFETFGDRVKTWITFNEPYDYCIPGYGDGNYPPMGRDHGVADYVCMDTTLKAHAEVYRLYRKEFYDRQRGKIGLSLNTRYYLSKTNNSTIIERALQYSFGFLSYPIFGENGNYPKVMLDDIARNSKEEGRAWSRLQSLSARERRIIKHSADFIGLNYYTSRYVEEAYPPEGEIPSFQHDSRLKYDVDEKWRKGNVFWMYCVPEGLEGLLKWIKKNYNNIEVIVTENGWPDDGQLNDTERIDFIQAHLQAVLNALNDGCNVTAYTVWSLIDNFEWQRGYTNKYGLYYVNMTSDDKERIPKYSARYYKNVIESKTIPQTLPQN